jgi:hypothetical protein
MLAFSSVASAQATRTWISGVGDDVNPCSRTAPCKTFAGAISKTAVGGEIDCLDPGGFGAVTITKALTFDCNSGASSILSGATNGIVINAGTGDIIVLRNLSISGNGNPLPVGLNGINVIQAKQVVLQNVNIRFFATTCMAVSSSSAVSVVADNSSFVNCPTAISAGNNSKFTINHSLITAAPTAGISQAGASQVLITGSTVSNTGTAFVSVAGSFIGVTGCILTNNNLVYNTNGGQILTGSDNPAFGNPATGATSGAVPKI